MSEFTAKKNKNILRSLINKVPPPIMIMNFWRSQKMLILSAYYHYIGTSYTTTTIIRVCKRNYKLLDKNIDFRFAMRVLGVVNDAFGCHWKTVIAYLYMKALEWNWKHREYNSFLFYTHINNDWKAPRIYVIYDVPAVSGKKRSHEIVMILCRMCIIYYNCCDISFWYTVYFLLSMMCIAFIRKLKTSFFYWPYISWQTWQQKDWKNR